MEEGETMKERERKKRRERHPSLDTSQKKNQKTHLADPKINQVEGIDIPKQEVAKFF